MDSPDDRAQVQTLGLSLRRYLIYKLTLDGMSDGEIGRTLGMTREKVGKQRKRIQAFLRDREHRERLNRREHNARQRARSFGAYVEPVDFHAVFVDADGRCYLCDEPVADDFDFDHVLALSRGGEHVRENIRLAHASCNRSKGSG